MIFKLKKITRKVKRFKLIVVLLSWLAGLGSSSSAPHGLLGSAPHGWLSSYSIVSLAWLGASFVGLAWRIMVGSAGLGSSWLAWLGLALLLVVGVAPTHGLSLALLLSSLSARLRSSLSRLIVSLAPLLIVVSAPLLSSLSACLGSAPLLNIGLLSSTPLLIVSSLSALLCSSQQP